MTTPAATQAGPAKFHAGTLVYTKSGVFTLFTWLLWGDISFTLMETVWGAIIPLELHSLSAPNTLISLVMLTIPQIMNFVLNPIISTASDRHRGPWGRRIPFLMFGTPFVAVILILMGFSRQIGAALSVWLHSGDHGWVNANTVTLGVIVALIVGYRFFELFVDTTYWYLFNDVVPPNLLGRFLGLFRVVGALTGALFNFCIYRYAESHATWIFLGIGLLYGAGFTMMCLNVKEGNYPDAEPMTGISKSPWAYINAYGRDCFSHRIFILVFGSGGVWAVALSCVAPFNVFWLLSMGLTLAQIGSIAGVTGLITGILSYPAGVLVDRFHPIRVQLLAKLGLCIAAPIGIVFLIFDFPPETVYWIYICKTAITIPFGAIYTAARLPLLMRTFPHERFGQFNSADSMVRAISLVVGSMLVGVLLDFAKTFYPGSEYYYRYIPVWSTILCGLSLGMTWMVFHEWKKLGGDKHYRPPCRDKMADLYQPDTDTLPIQPR